VDSGAIYLPCSANLGTILKGGRSSNTLLVEISISRPLGSPDRLDHFSEHQ